VVNARRSESRFWWPGGMIIVTDDSLALV
jgi:hypothetical protein